MRACRLTDPNCEAAAHGGDRVRSPPHPTGTEAVLRDLGYDAAAIGRLRAASAI
jgi:hypothetical protein